VIGAWREILVAPQNPTGTLERLSAPTTRVVTITVTEKGYCLDRGGSLDPAHPDIQHDMSHPRAPRSLIGYLVEGLRRRKLAGGGPLAIISCDNLVDNGVRLKGAVVELARSYDPALAGWIQENQYFPRTMVDSITPATTPALKERVAAVLQLTDRWPVQRESFTQWVLEDRLPPGGPDWASVGVTLTDDVAAYDRAKLRLLNGAHSTLAYVGLLAGHVTVADAMKDNELRSLVVTLMKEDILPTLRAPRGLDLNSYIETILRRFRNPAINHLLAQIAWDGSQKLPFRLAGTLLDTLEAGRPLDRLCVPIAAWMHFVRRRALEGVRVTDPLADRLFDIGRATENRADRDLGPFLALDAVFPPALARSPLFTQALARAYDNLAQRGRL
jgi:fructuronate reductase